MLVARRDRLRHALIAFAAVVRRRHAVLAHRSRAGGPVRRRCRRPRRKARRPVGDRDVSLADGGRLQHRALARPRGRARARARRPRQRHATRHARWRSVRVGVPVAAFLAARVGGSASPESRHLIFVLPFFAILVGAGILRSTRRFPAAAVDPHRRPRRPRDQLGLASHAHSSSNGSRTSARRRERRPSASSPTTSRRDDLLFGYEPLYLGAWERNPSFPDVVAPARRRGARPAHARSAAEAARPRRLDPRCERAEQPPAPARDREPRSRPCRGLRDAGLRAVPRHPHPRAGANGGRLPRCGCDARCSSAARSGSATPTSTCRRSSVPTACCRGYGPSLRLRSDTSR